jgi:hypothetical protein
VVVEEGSREGLHGLGQRVCGLLAGLAHLVAVPSLGEPGRLTGEHHRGPGLAHEVEQPVDEPLARDAAIADHASVA